MWPKHQEGSLRTAVSLGWGTSPVPLRFLTFPLLFIKLTSLQGGSLKNRFHFELVSNACEGTHLTWRKRSVVPFLLSPYLVIIMVTHNKYWLSSGGNFGSKTHNPVPPPSTVTPVLSVFPFALSLLACPCFRPEVPWVLPPAGSTSFFELFSFLVDIFQKLAAVKDQREWVTTSGVHKVSGPGKRYDFSSPCNGVQILRGPDPCYNSQV